MKTNYAFLKQREMKNTGFLGVARRFLHVIFSKFLQINNPIPYLLAVQKKFIFRSKFFCPSHLNEAF